MSSNNNLRHDRETTKVLLRCAKTLEENSGLNASDTFKEVIKSETDEDLITLIHSFSPGEKIGKVELRRTRGRPTQQCIRNAIAENKKTGNKIVWGYMTSQVVGRHVHCIIHVFNQDKDGTFYDTQELPEGCMWETIASVSDTEFTTQEIYALYDYYYIKTRGRTFRFRRLFGADTDYEFEAEII